VEINENLCCTSNLKLTILVLRLFSPYLNEECKNLPFLPDSQLADDGHYKSFNNDMYGKVTKDVSKFSVFQADIFDVRNITKENVLFQELIVSIFHDLFMMSNMEPEWRFSLYFRVVQV